MQIDDSHKGGQADPNMPSDNPSKKGLRGLLYQYVEGDLLSWEAARAIIVWIATQEGSRETLRQVHQMYGMDGAVPCDLPGIAHRILGLSSY